MSATTERAAHRPTDPGSGAAGGGGGSARPARPVGDRVRQHASRVTLRVLLVAVAAVTLLPFVLMLLVALSPPGSLTLPETLIPSDIGLEHFRRVLSGSSLLRWTLNSFIYSLGTVVLILFLASMAGYAFAKKRFPGREALFWSFLATLMVPLQIYLIPYFILVARLGGIDTYWGLIVPPLANVQAVFLMRQFIRDLPDELFEAARVDGASDWRIYWQIVLPLTKPALATLGIFVFLWHWNDFLWPLVVAQSDSMRTLTVGLATLQGQNIPLGQVMAGATISVVPSIIVFALFQRYVVNNIAMSGIKG